MKKQSLSDVILFSILTICMAVCFILVYLPKPEKQTEPTGLSNFAVLEDPDGLMMLSDVQTSNSSFISQTSSTIFKKHSTSAFWIKCMVEDITAKDSSRFLKINAPNIEDIDIYFSDGTTVKEGKKVDVRLIPIKSRAWFVPIPTGQTVSDPLYIRVRSSTILRIPLKIVSSSQMIDDTNADMIFFGICFGILIAMFFINLFSYFILQRKIFIIYVCYLFFLILYHFRVHGFMYFIPTSFEFREAIVWISLSGFGICMIIFAQQFMELKRRLPVMDTLFNVGIAIFLLQMIVGVFFSSVYANSIAYITGFIIPLLIMGTLVYLYRKGHTELRYYLIAYCALLTATVIWATMPYTEEFISPNHLFIAGTSIDTLLFTLSIFDLIKGDLREKDDLKEREKYYMTLSRTDALTGLYNRRYLSDIVKRLEMDHEMPAISALFMVDLDHFKNINDSYGHLIGDIMLTKTGTTIKKHIRHTDIACRYGGDEFLVLLPGANLDAARAIADKIQKEVLADISYSETGEVIRHTVSIGVTATRNDDSFDGMFLRADAALYQAKKTGRNRIAVL